MVGKLYSPMEVHAMPRINAGVRCEPVNFLFALPIMDGRLCGDARLSLLR
jgi:hypothetical protein